MSTPISANEINWKRHYEDLKEYVAQTGHFPRKNTTLSNWIKYQRKRIKAGLLDPEKKKLFEELSASRNL